MPDIEPNMLVPVIQHHLPGRTILRVENCGVWIRHNFKITLQVNNGVHAVVYLKMDQAFPASEKEAYISQLLRSHGLPAPQILAVDTSGEWLPAPFIIQEHIGGERMGRLLDRVDAPDKVRIYKALGRFYKQLHSIHHEHSGWIHGAGEVLPYSPTHHQYNEVIVKIGQQAVEHGYLATDVHKRLKRLWAKHIDWLDQHTPSLVGGALHWVMYLKHNGDWHVTKVMDLHDFLYWDPAWDLAGIKYPVFREPLTPELWDAFTSEYGDVPGEKRLKLYRLLQCVDAALGNYKEPTSKEHECWKDTTWETFEQLLDETESETKK